MLTKAQSRSTVLVCLLAIISLAVGLSTYRVFQVPILQCPDEDTHFDYAIAIFSNGGLLQASKAPHSGWHTKSVAAYYDWERISHILTLHLSTFTNMLELRVSEANKVSADYGTAEYFARLDAAAPKVPMAQSLVTPADNPWILAAYPFGYYSAVALVIKAVSLWSDSLVMWFFAARLFSVVLLAGSIVALYGFVRELKFRAVTALTITAGFATLPIANYIGSCIQPDNLGLFAVLITTFFGFRILRVPTPWAYLGFALSLSLLASTKNQFFLFAAPPLLLALWVRRRLTFWSGLLLMIPTACAIAGHLWVTSGAPVFLSDHIQRSSNWLLSGLNALRDFWLGGGAFRSFWSTSYAYVSLPLLVKAPLLILSPAMVVLALWFYWRSFSFAVRLWRNESPNRALRFITANPALTAHASFSGFMVLLYTYTDNGFYAQGRHFLPFVPAGILLVLIYLPRLIPWRQWRRPASVILIAGLFVYNATASLHMIRATQARYYVATPK